MNYEWKIIDGIKKWKRICPQCSKDVWYFDRSSVYRKSNQIKICKNCKKENKKLTYTRNCPCCNKLIKHNTYKYFWYAKTYNIKCRSCGKIGNKARLGKKNSEFQKNQVGIALRGRKISEEAKLKMRLAAIKRIKEKNIKPYTNYNTTACKYFNELNEQFGWNLQHALNGGEIECYGYFLDAYDKIKNVVVEYDEARHNKPSIKKKDIIRQNNIIKELNCSFYRFNETKNVLYKVN